MKGIKFIQNSIVLLLCICILGFFANWAQNDYGMNLVLICLLCIGVLLGIYSYTHIHRKKIIRELFAFSFLFPFTFPILVKFNVPLDTLMILFVSCILLLTLILPFIILLSERKASEKTNLGSFFPSIFLSLFCFGNVFKVLHMHGAAIILVSSSFIIFPYFTFAVRKLISSYQQKSFTELFLATLHFFNGTNILAYCFKIQHWPYSSEIAYATILLLLIVFIIGTIIVLKKLNLRQCWLSLPWIKRLIFVSFSITSIHYLLRINDLTPALYSSENPAALQELWGNANNITKEGRENAKKAEAYNNNYLNFIQNREIDEQKKKGE